MKGIMSMNIRKRPWALGLILAGAACGSGQQQASTAASRPAASPKPAIAPASASTTPPAPVAQFPWPQNLTKPDTAVCVQAEERVQSGLALLDDVWLAATCVLHRLPDSTPEAQAAFASAVEAFRDSPATAAATMTIYGKDLPEPLLTDYNATGGDANTKVDILVVDARERETLKAKKQEHLGMGSWRGICLPWQAKAGHSNVTREALKNLDAAGYHLSSDAIGVLTDAAQDPDFFAWLKMEAHAQTSSDALGKPKNADQAQDAFATFVSTNLNKATSACKDAVNGKPAELRKALYWAGYSVHAIQDLAPHQGRTNPEHSFNAKQGQNPDLNDDAIKLALDMTVRYFTYVFSTPLKPCMAQLTSYNGGAVTPLFKVVDLGLRYDNSPQALLEYKQSSSLFEKLTNDPKAKIRWFGGDAPPKKCSDNTVCERLLGRVMK
jgi:hypothetical protein